MPTLIGAGVGAVGSAITGQSPIKGALLGGATGGLSGGSDSLWVGKIADMFSSGVTPGVALTTDAAGTAIAPGMGINNLFSQVPTTGISTNLQNLILAHNHKAQLL